MTSCKRCFQSITSGRWVICPQHEAEIRAYEKKKAKKA